MKTSNFSKRSLCIVFLVLPALHLFAGDVTIRKGDDPTNPTQPNVVSYNLINDIPVTATEDNSELAVYFEEAIGNATLRVYDADNQLVYQATVDTNTQSAVVINISNLSSGNYRLTINYSSTYLYGDFSIE